MRHPANHRTRRPALPSSATATPPSSRAPAASLAGRTRGWASSGRERLVADPETGGSEQAVHDPPVVVLTEPRRAPRERPLPSLSRFQELGQLRSEAPRADVDQTPCRDVRIRRLTVSKPEAKSTYRPR